MTLNFKENFTYYRHDAKDRNKLFGSESTYYMNPGDMFYMNYTIRTIKDDLIASFISTYEDRDRYGEVSSSNFYWITPKLNTIMYLGTSTRELLCGKLPSAYSYNAQYKDTFYKCLFIESSRIGWVTQELIIQLMNKRAIDKAFKEM